jgi:hypothetical protein
MRHSGPTDLMKLSMHDLACAIADEGGWEEYHQKRTHNYEMMDHHKARRKLLEQRYRSLKK